MEQALTTTSESLVPAPTPQTDIDKMFSGLGLDPFAFNNNKQPEKSQPVIPSAVSTAGSLSIEEKQR